MPVPAPASPPEARRRWVILGLLMALCFLSHFNRASIANAGDERIMKQFGLSEERMGFVYSAFLMVYTLFMIPGGWFIDRYGPRVALGVMAAGSAVFCAGTGLVGFSALAATQVWVGLLLIRSTMGLLTTPLHPGAAHAVSGWFAPGEQALANGLITGASVLAYAAVHPVFGALIDRWDWPRAFLITAVATVALGIAWWSLGRDRPVMTEVPEEGFAAAVVATKPTSLWEPRLILLTASYAAVGYFQYIFFYWLHYYFDEVLHLGKLESRYYAGLPNLAMAAAMPLGGVIIDRIDRLRGVAVWRARVPLVGMLLSGGLLLAGIATRERFWVVLWFTLALGCLGLCESSFWTTAVRLGGSQAGLSAAIMNTGGNGIGLLAPLLTPFISRHFGWSSGLALGAGIAMLGGLCWLGIHLPRRSPS